jgi:hypothetical protein
MPIKNTIKLFTGASCTTLLLALAASSTQAQNLLSDPGFESGTAVASGVGGWQTFNGGTFSSSVSFTGTYSMLLSGPGGYTVPGCVQFLSASAGMQFDLTGYGYISSALTGNSEAILQITFFSGLNGAGSNLGTVATTPGNAQPSNPINSSSPLDTWIPLSEDNVTAPVGTESIGVYCITLDANAASANFDDLTLTTVPEPSTYALAGLGLGTLFFWRQRLARVRAN